MWYEKFLGIDGILFIISCASLMYRMLLWTIQRDGVRSYLLVRDFLLLR